MLYGITAMVSGRCVMRTCWTEAWLVGGVLALVMSACSGGGSKPLPGTPCLMNSECNNPLSCTFGGAGGMGAVFLEQNGASFLYVKSDGATRLSTGTVISSSSGGQVAISNYHGSFAVSLYETATHSTQVVASECTK